MQNQEQKLTEEQLFKIEQTKRAKLERKMKNATVVVNTFRMEDDPKYQEYLDNQKSKQLEISENYKQATAHLANDIQLQISQTADKLAMRKRRQLARTLCKQGLWCLVEYVFEVVALKQARETENPQGDLNRTVDLADEKIESTLETVKQILPEAVEQIVEILKAEAHFQRINLIRECEIQHSKWFADPEECKIELEPQTRPESAIEDTINAKPA